MKRRALFHCVFAVLLLVAQQGALLHAVWHAHDGQQVQARNACELAKHSDRNTPSQAILCPFDMAFGQVLGGTHGSAQVLAFAPVVFEHIHDLSAPRLQAEALSPKSRGPPVLA